MKFLKGLTGLMILCCGLFFTGCEDSAVEKSTVTAISSFYFSADDDIPALATAVFSINTDTVFSYNGLTFTGFIQNRDSLPYGTSVRAVVPVIASGTQFSKVLIGDTLTYSGSDTVDFSKPVKLLVYAQNEDSTQRYLVKTNVHRIDHELYVWNQRTYPDVSGVSAEKAFFFRNKIYLFRLVAGVPKLHTSADAKSWTEENLNGLATVSVEHIVQTPSSLYVISGANLYASANGLDWTSTPISGFTFERLLFGLNGDLIALAKNGDNYLLVKSSDAGANWVKGYDCPASFPVSAFSLLLEKSPSGKIRVAAIGGKDKFGKVLNSVWLTENGSYWIDCRDGVAIPARQNAAAISYDHNVLLFGGLENGVVADSLALSPDFGLSWVCAGRKIEINQRVGFYTPGESVSVIVDEANLRIYVIGGKNDGGFIQKVWTGKKNETYFAEYE